MIHTFCGAKVRRVDITDNYAKPKWVSPPTSRLSNSTPCAAGWALSWRLPASAVPHSASSLLEPELVWESLETSRNELWPGLRHGLSWNKRCQTCTACLGQSTKLIRQTMIVSLYARWELFSVPENLTQRATVIR